jgi:aminoglycoside 6-adenylyltransferase
MRSVEEMLNLILGTARDDERIRAVMLNGSRANPNAPRDRFQDYDIIYFVTELAPYVEDRTWINRFGERMILQTPDEMDDPPPDPGAGFTYLIQFMDGNRIDLSLHPVERLEECLGDSLSVVLLDKDGCIPPLPAPDESSYIPAPPTAKQYADCCCEFWWVAPYAAKGLCRRQIIYAKNALDSLLRIQLMKMLAWQVGLEGRNPGKFGKNLDRCLPPEQWNQLLETYAGAGTSETWAALFAMCALFEQAARRVGERCGHAYPQEDASRVMMYLKNLALGCW